MANKTDNASMFRLVTGVVAALLIIAAALVYLQGRGGAGSSSSELAALSQALPAQVERALAGEDAAFDRLDTSVNRINTLRRGGAPGSAADWTQLESGAAAVLAKREAAETVTAAARRLGSGAQALLE